MPHSENCEIGTRCATDCTIPQDRLNQAFQVEAALCLRDCRGLFTEAEAFFNGNPSAFTPEKAASNRAELKRIAGVIAVLIKAKASPIVIARLNALGIELATAINRGEFR